MKRALLLVLASAGLALAPAVNAQTSTWTIDTAHSSIGFAVKHLGVSTVRGTLTGIKGTVTLDEKDITKSTVEAVIDANSVNTNVEARDKHLKSPDFFNVAANPTLTFKSTKLVSAGGKTQLIGDLTLAGVTKSVTFDLDGPAPAQKGQGGKIISGFSATGSLSRSNFNFGTKFGSAMLSDDVKFTIDVEIDKVQ
ncbi:Polyisoprenoid-binding protein YceI [Granulicella pectinivorans]|jgi:polyisoprenoid-binding protein YceI|uniref:Polyisoprenoid-binding protein YceI n=1 Tax=Granulicella pectinivorans TaxID=474950 RepID=A0A1I6MY61_9BACT|nr:YceI family protein [Granulicella pectinivorans]SFS20643.1 Polyisoprenoid-binding protein YceI [Granulicella pectinivorans]